MNKILLFVAVQILFTSCATKEKISQVYDDEKVECLSLEHCLRLVPTVSSDGFGSTFRERYFAKQFAQFGEPALVALLQLSHSEKKGDRKIAGIGISHFDNIDEEYLDEIAGGIDRGISSLPSALSKIKTERAARIAVEKYLISDSAPHNQEAYAVKVHGERALPHLFQAAQCTNQCRDNTLYLSAYVIGEMGKSARKKAIRDVIDVVKEDDLSISDQQNLLFLLTEVGPVGRFAEEELLTIRESQTELSDVIDRVFIGIHSKYSGRVFASLIEESPDNYLLLRDVAEMGAAARDAGPVIQGLINHPDPYIRVNAIRALGFLKYEPVEGVIINVLKNTNDAQLAWVSATALGMIGQSSSLESLKTHGVEHWHPAVEEASKLAVERIQSGTGYKSTYYKKNFAYDFFQYSHLNTPSCERVSLDQLKEDQNSKLYIGYAEERLKALEYDSFIFGFGAADEDEQLEEDPNGVVEVNQYNIAEYREDIKQIPNMALRIDDGWLAGSSRGEWGGELVYIPDGADAETLISDNIEDIYRLGDRVVVVAGLAHLSMNHGMIYSVQRNAGVWDVEPWLNLPGAPRSSWFVETGELLINTNRGGSVLLNTDGTLRMAPCEKYEPDN